MDPSQRHFIEEASHFLRRVSIFSELEADALREVAGKLKSLSLPKGAVLYHQGDPGDALYVIESGRVQIVGQSERGRERTLNYLGRGDAFGETALLTGASRSVTVRVDATATFLVLTKEDFDDFLKKSPAASYYLSRFLSRRLSAATRLAPEERPAPELLGFLGSLEKEDWVLFMLNQGLSLLEQTRRRVLLLDLSGWSGALVSALGQKPLLSSSGMLRAEDLRDPRLLSRLTQMHPSGLEILALSEETFAGSLYLSIPNFLATLRERYDLVMVCLNQPGALGAGRQERLKEVRLSFLRECDSLFLAARGETARLEMLASLIKPLSAENSPQPKKILLGSNPSPGAAVDFVVPWDDALGGRIKRGAPPYFTDASAAGTYRGLAKIARAVGKLRVGIAMGSGAAYGYASIGIMRVLEREGIPVDFISGTSMGALLGSFFAMGKSAAEVEEIAFTITKIWLRRNILSDLNLPWPHGGVLLGHTVSRFLRSVLGERGFDDLAVPFACVATDILTGEGVVLKEGKVWEAVRASLSLPLVFCPYKMGGRYLVDGGLVNPVPTSVIALMGADLLFSVNLTSKISEQKVSLRRLRMFPQRSPGLFGIFFKMLYTMQYQIAAARTDLAHVVIRPDAHNFSWVDFHKAKQIIPLGEEAAEESLTKIKSLLPYFADHCRFPIRPAAGGRF